MKTDRIIDIFFELIGISAISRQEKPVADYIRRFIARYNLPVFEDTAGISVGGNSGNLIIPVGVNNTTKPVALFAHMDTVRPTHGINAHVNNGKIVTDGNTILGADNRAGIALILAFIEHVMKNNLPHSSFEAVFTIGEETGLFGSSNLDLDLVTSRTAYILDSSADPGSYVSQSPGALEFEIEFFGKPSHAAVQPDAGVNALKMASRLVCQFPAGQVNPETTVNFGRLTGGEANNIVPPYSKISGEIRSFDKEQLEHFSRRLEREAGQIAESAGGRCVLKTSLAFPAFELDPEAEALKTLDQAYRVCGLEPRRLRYHGGSDANILNNRGFVAIDMGIGAKNPHSPDEFIAIEDLHKMSDVLVQLLSN